ncbi:hypothetical protein QBC35DRAFT_536450 [Podospora australis]|uniref:Uncharacterized protein n=1 Tax=Podospora australis TaxID=1536484 RepID=A0AAN6WII5_9PEZI|nr:hypothetical protein QBC35DRAFT_536450 [Podospora australis]
MSPLKGTHNSRLCSVCSVHFSKARVHHQHSLEIRTPIYILIWITKAIIATTTASMRPDIMIQSNSSSQLSTSPQPTTEPNGSSPTTHCNSWSESTKTGIALQVILWLFANLTTSDERVSARNWFINLICPCLRDRLCPHRSWSTNNKHIADPAEQDLSNLEGVVIGTRQRAYHAMQAPSCARKGVIFSTEHLQMNNSDLHNTTELCQGVRNRKWCGVSY